MFEQQQQHQCVLPQEKLQQPPPMITSNDQQQLPTMFFSVVAFAVVLLVGFLFHLKATAAEPPASTDLKLTAGAAAPAANETKKQAAAPVPPPEPTPPPTSSTNISSNKTSSKQDEEFGRDCSLSFIDATAVSDDTTALKEALIFLKGAMTAREEELNRLREEKNEAIESKFSFMAEMERLKNQLEMQAKMLLHAEKEKEEANEKVKLFTKEIKLLHEQKEKGDTIQPAREIDEAMAEMKGAMKAQGEEMERLREENNAALESKLCIIEEVTGLREKVEMQGNMLVQVQKENEEVTLKLSQAKEEKEVAIKSAKQQNVETTSKLIQTELTLKEALYKLDYLEEEMERKTNKYIVSLGSFVWKISGTTLVSRSSDIRVDDVLNCAPLKSGTFEWKIKVHSAKSNCLNLGVIGSSLKLPFGDWIGCTNKTWGYESGECGLGRAYYWKHGSISAMLNLYLPKYKDGSVVHFVLDLTEVGTLSVSVDRSPIIPLFFNMKSLIDKDEGFLPATSMTQKSKIELLDFQCR